MRKSRKIKIGNLDMGGGAPVRIQSMLNVCAGDIEGNVQQAVALEQAGCELIRTAVPNKEAVALIPALKKAVSVPIVADIHYDYRLALDSIAAGVDKVRINPGNIGAEDRVKQVAEACKQNRVPVRIGVNSGSVEKCLLEKYGGPTPEALVESALYHASLLEKFDFEDIVLSINRTYGAYQVGDRNRFAAATRNRGYHQGLAYGRPGARNCGST